MNPSQLEDLHNDFINRDIDSYKLGIRKISNEIPAMNLLDSMKALTAINNFQEEKNIAGLQPIIFEILNHFTHSSEGKIDSNELQKLNEFPLFNGLPFEDLGAIFPEPPVGYDDFWPEFFQLNPYDLPPERVRDLIKQAASEKVEYKRIKLPDDATEPIVLESRNACSEVPLCFLDFPDTVSNNFIVELSTESLFEDSVLVKQDGKSIGFRTWPQLRLPIDARSESFSLRIVDSSRVWNFTVVIPIIINIKKSCDFTNKVLPILDQKKSIDLKYYSSGPQGKMVWNFSGGLPNGINFERERNLAGHLTGHSKVLGEVVFGAHSTIGELQLSNGRDFAKQELNFKVRVHISDADREYFSSTVFSARHEDQVDIPLPTPYGGDGNQNNYRFILDTNSELPEGVEIKRLNNDWSISGVVDNAALIRFYVLKLKIISGKSEYSTELTIKLNLYSNFRVFTQNMILLPSSYAPSWLWASCLWPFSAPICAVQVGVEIAWLKIHNTSDDNQDRVQCLLNKIVDEDIKYDIIALQEIWKTPFNNSSYYDVRDSVNSLGYDYFEGPSDSGVEMNSGLILLVKNQLKVQKHFGREVFNDSGGDDSYSQKGFTLTQVRLSANEDEYIYVVNTHLQAPEQDREIRQKQINQLLNFIYSNTEVTHPIILMGDLNIIADANNDEYSSFQQTLSGFDDIFEPGNIDFYTINSNTNFLKKEWGDKGGSEFKRLDYILIRQGTRYGIIYDDRKLENDVCITEKCINSGKVDSTSNLKCYMSDHYGLSVNMKFVHIKYLDYLAE